MDVLLLVVYFSANYSIFRFPGRPRGSPLPYTEISPAGSWYGRGDPRGRPGKLTVALANSRYRISNTSLTLLLCVSNRRYAILSYRKTGNVCSALWDSGNERRTFGTTEAARAETARGQRQRAG